MNLFEFTRALVDIESITDNERNVGDFLFERLSVLAKQHRGQAERMDVEPGRFNVFARWGSPVVTLSTHMDTVPPFFPSREDHEFVWGRGACDAKGIIASMIAAAEKLLADGVSDFGLLFVVGEERNSAGARVAARMSRGSRFLINGEPTENKLAVASKGALRFEVRASGQMAHSGYPKLGHSAINDLLDVLEDLRRIALPTDRLLGKSTMNIGTISAGRAPNVIADQAEAEIMFRLVGDPEPIREAVRMVVAERVKAHEVLYTPVRHLFKLNGLPTTIVAFTTDIPTLEESWGAPFLIGPGNIHLAHTAEERVSKQELSDAVEIYAGMVKRLLRPDRKTIEENQ